MRTAGRPTGRSPGRAAAVALFVGLVAVAIVAHAGRRRLIRGLFVDGPPRASTGLGPAGAPAPGVDRVRIVLIDGLGREAARGLPALDAVCAEGIDLVVDAGFPTVSLPVQHVLWTGLLQQQSGILFRVDRIASPPAAALPPRVMGSRAVAESHPRIVHSFGFAVTEPPLDVDVGPGSAWREDGFARAAREAVLGEERLAFVHVLRVDEAGHRAGAASEAYREAARSADALLGELYRAASAARPRGTRWLVLADHGHLPGGGHGDAEPTIRLTRACVAGELAPGAAGTRGAVRLVDLARLVADSLGLALPAASPGRPLGRALTRPPADPLAEARPGAGRIAAAIVLALAGLALGLRLAGGRLLEGFPLWWALGLCGVLAVDGPPSLSRPVVFPPLGRDLALHALPGLLALLGLAAWERRLAPARLAAAQLAGPTGLALGALTLCGALDGRVPPLAPTWTGAASVALSLVASGAAALALPALARAVRGRSDRSPPRAGWKGAG